MENNQTKIVTLIPSATEIVAFLGKQDSIVGCSHECDYPKNIKDLFKLTSPKLNIDGTSQEIDKQINKILINSLSVYKIDVDKLKELEPDFIVTQDQCEVCAVSFSEVEDFVKEHLNQKTKIISLSPNTLNDVFNDIKKVAKTLGVLNETNKNKINKLELRLSEIKEQSAIQIKKPSVACIEWINPLMIAGNWIPEMVEIAGGTNVLGKNGENSHWIEFDEIASIDPDLIIFLPCGFNISKTMKELKMCLNNDLKWETLKAYQNNKLFVADGNQFFNRPGPRLIESLEILAEIIHPNIFKFNHEQTGWIKYKQNRI